MPHPALEFGIYPLSAAGTPEGLAVGPPDDYAKIRRVLDDLRGHARILRPRTYLISMGPGSEAATLAQADRYQAEGLLAHATLGTLQDTPFELGSWLDLIRTFVDRYGARIASLQITNEPNLTFMEGAKPFIVEALIHGVITAKSEARRRGLRLDIGFGSVPASPVALPRFWDDLATAGPEFRDALDFVGHNFYVDVFEEPVALAEVPARVEAALRELRLRDMATAGIPPSVAIRVTENGWPTGTNPLANTTRTDAHQAQVLEALVRAVNNVRAELNVSHYMLFGLRDADSSEQDLFHQFGIVRDDYEPKPAYATFKGLIGELGAEG